MKAEVHGPKRIQGGGDKAAPVYVVTVDDKVLCVSVDADACRRIVERVNNSNVWDLLPLVVDCYVHQE